jgi:predicted AAA+ superfamily ATPase
MNIKQAIIEQQNEALDYTNSQALITREALPSLEEMLNGNLITVIMGMRRTGKSTLALQYLKNKNFLYLNFDDEVLAQTKAANLNSILEMGLSVCPDAKFLFFDEIQNIKSWELFINRLARQKYKIIITGSNSRLLSSELASHLTGRHLSLELFPFSFFEFLVSKNIPLKNKNSTTKENAEYLRQFNIFFNTSGLPQVATGLQSERLVKNYLKDLFDKIVTRDIAQRRKIKNIKVLKELSLLSLSLYSSQFTYQSLKKTCGISSINTVKNYIDYLQESYLIFCLEPFSFKVKERISLPKKFYTIDLALTEAVLSSNSGDLGKKLENIIFLELKRRGHEIYYIKGSNYEVDFAIKEGRKITSLMQVSWSIDNEITKERELSSLIKGARDFKIDKLYLITESTDDLIKVDDLEIVVIPAWKWLLNYE